MTPELVIVVLMPMLLLIAALGFITMNRYIAYKERVALAQLGYSLEDLSRHTSMRRHGSRGVLWGGVITAMSGAALLLGLATLGAGAWLLGGLIPLFVGLGMILIYFLTSSAVPEKDAPLTGSMADEELPDVLKEHEDLFRAISELPIEKDPGLGRFE